MRYFNMIQRGYPGLILLPLLAFTPGPFQVTSSTIGGAVVEKAGDLVPEAIKEGVVRFDVSRTADEISAGLDLTVTEEELELDVVAPRPTQVVQGAESDVISCRPREEEGEPLKVCAIEDGRYFVSVLGVRRVSDDEAWANVRIRWIEGHGNLRGMDVQMLVTRSPVSEDRTEESSWSVTRLGQALVI